MLLWACGPAFFALRAGFSPLRRVTFFLRAQKKSNQKKTAPCGAFRITSDPLRSFPQLACIGGGRGGSVLKRETPQPCRLKPPRKICLTRNPPEAIRNSLEKHPSLATLLGLSSFVFLQRGSRGTVRNLRRVSSSFCGQPPAFSRRLY